MPLNIFIYRPDKRFHPNVNLDCCYTISGQHYRDWQKDQDEAYAYKVNMIKEKLNEMPKHKVEDYWR
jgi:hypothetical protein